MHETREDLRAEDIALLAEVDCPPPPPGAKDRVAMAVLEALSEDEASDAPPATVRRIG